MKSPLQALLIAPNEDMRRMIVEGKKTATVRYGLRGYEPGPVMLCCHLVPWAVQADIVEVVHTTLERLTQAQVEAEGHDSPEHMLFSLQTFYPDIRWNSPITFIRWKNVRGWCVDAARAKRTNQEVPAPAWRRATTESGSIW